MPSEAQNEYTDEFSFSGGGFYPNSNVLEQMPQIIQDGQNLWVRNARMGNFISDMGPLNIGSAGGAIVPAMVSLNLIAGLTGGGVVTGHSGVPWFQGFGSAFQGGVLLGVTNGVLMLVVSGSAFAAGLTAPPAPVIAATGGVSAKMTGSYSVALAYLRTATGAVSNRSDFSNVVFAQGQKLLFTPATTAPAGLQYLVYGTLRGYGSIGPQFRVTVIPPTANLATLNAAGGIEWWDGDLGDLAFLANDPPLPGTHCASMGSFMVDLGVLTYGGSPSALGLPEAFDPSQIFFLAAKEPITGVVPYSSEGIVYVATNNSLNVLVLAGTSDSPVLPRGLWAQTGFSSGNAFCLAFRTIYGFSGSANANGGAMGAVRTQGMQEPDTSFALPVSTWFKDNGYTGTNTTVVYAPDQNAVYFCSGNKALPFNLEDQTWSTPMILPGTVTGGTTLNGQGVLLLGSSMYILNAGNGVGINWFMRSGYHQGQLRHPYVPVKFQHQGKWIRYLSALASDILTYSILKDGNGALVSSQFPWTPPTAQYAALQNLQSYCKSYALKVAGNAGGQKFFGSQVLIEIDPTLFGVYA